ncbi:MAG: universal stress protein [Saprospiraceae bacterium]|nr:universal stress protein [Saprospiraceae bacterium]HMW39873.1 universal stress protein [Saprospiraceae bacterium]HMX88295.1 universal stress protein [Saprospiraceae bacterium]HMZ40421.1 universal stress protein [Saprospiraceae bacterium]HNA65026.1 universal stress protein [Saprospiraceae bacterium]
MKEDIILDSASKLRRQDILFKIKIAGVDPDKNIRFEESLTQLLTARNIPFEIEVVDELNGILDLHVRKTPVVMINDQVAFEEILPDAKKLNEIIDHFLQIGTFRLKKIVVPIDFSENAEHALKLALRWTEKWDSEVKLVHVIPPYVDGMNPESALVMAEQQNILMQGAEKSMQEFIARAGQNASRIKSVVLLGDPGLTICREAEEADADMIMMGATGIHGLLDKLFGSVSSVVATHSKVPVLLIPGRTEEISLRKIVYASDYSSASLANIFYIMRLAHQYDGRVDFIHVSHRSPEEESIKEIKLKQLLEEIHPSARYRFDIIDRHEVADALYDYAAQQQADLVVTVHKSRDFWQRIVERSLSGKLAFEAKMPVLVLQN